jgi:hypothetical protein
MKTASFEGYGILNMKAAPTEEQSNGSKPYPILVCAVAVIISTDICRSNDPLELCAVRLSTSPSRSFAFFAQHTSQLKPGGSAAH